MKKTLLIALLLASSLAHAVNPWDWNITIYDQFATGTVNRLVPLPAGGVPGILVFDPSTNNPKLATYDSSLLMSGLVLSVNPSLLSGKFDTPTGNVAQYLRGDGTLATFPAIPPSVSLTTTGTSGVATYNTSTGALNIPNYAVPVSTINDAPGRALVTTTASTGFQISSTRPTRGCYEGAFSTTSTIGGPSGATVFLETADTNSTTPGDWTTKAHQTYSNTITLAIVLNQVQGNNWSMCRDIPAGKFVRLRSGSISGTASASINTDQQEVTN